ncbi:MAG: hypothetical protein KGR26_00150 [Cyanobacteria bacterium REEB65]|nr:hypothetical protein [Cyanobacteria bacterium REEB65]
MPTWQIERLVLVATMAAGISGCFGDTLRRPATSARILVVAALDRTEQGAGMAAARALGAALAAAGDRVVGVVPRPASVLPPPWLEAECQRWEADTVATATLSAWSVQRDRRRAFVEMTALLLSTEGNIRWAERIRGTAPWWPGPDSVMVAAATSTLIAQDKLREAPLPDVEALDTAAQNAAKEFAIAISSRL